MKALNISFLFFLLGCHNVGLPAVTNTVTQIVPAACEPIPLATLTERSNHLNVFPSRDGAGEPFQYMVLNVETNVPVEFSARESHAGVYFPVAYINGIRQGSFVHNGKAMGLWLFSEIGENNCFRFYQLTVGLGVPPQTVSFGRLIFEGVPVSIRVDLCENHADGRCFRGETRVFSPIIR